MSNYFEETKGFITASKLKDYMTNPYLYKVKWIDWNIIEKESERYFLVWEAFHDLMEKGRDAFLEKYSITDEYLKSEIMDLILNRFRENGVDEADIEAHKKRLKKADVTLPKLREEWYWSADWAKNQTKVQLTWAEGRDLLGMYEAVLKQPIRDLWGDYIKEQRFTAQYKSLKLSFKPDRIQFYDKNGNYYQLDAINEILLWKHKTEQEKIINDLWLICTIRDYKSTGEILQIKKEFEWDWDTKYWYVVSMSFYYTLIYVLYGIKAGVYLDFVEKSEPYLSLSISIPESRLWDKLKTDIIPSLDSLDKDTNANEFALPTMDQILQNKEIKRYYNYIPVYQTEPYYIDLI